MSRVNRVGLALLFVVALLVIGKCAGAETLQCLPAHTPYRADAGMDPWLFGLLCAIGGALFILGVYFVVPEA